MPRSKSLWERAMTSQGRKKRSVIDRALGGRKNRRRRGGMLGAMGALTRSKVAHGLDRYMDLRKPSKRTRELGIVRQVRSSLRDRLGPTERAQIRREVDEAIEQDRDLNGENQADRLAGGRETFLQRMIRIAKERLGRA